MAQKINVNTRLVYKVAGVLRLAVEAQVEPSELIPAVVEDAYYTLPYQGTLNDREEYRVRLIAAVRQIMSRPYAASTTSIPVEPARIALGGIEPYAGLPSAKSIRKLMAAYQACARRRKTRLTSCERWKVINRLERAGHRATSRHLADQWELRRALNPLVGEEGKPRPHCPLLFVVHTPSILIASGQYDGQYHQTAWEESRREMGVPRTGARLP